MTSRIYIWMIRHRRSLIFFVIALVHLGALIFIRFALPPQTPKEEPDYKILKLVDVEEFIPPPPPPEAKIVRRVEQPAASEEVVVTEQEVIVVEEEIPTPAPPSLPKEPEFIPQHKISEIPIIPTKEILDRIQYPPMALKQRIEGVVYLELFIDNAGVIRRIEVLKDPGFGFAQAALTALEGMVCQPAKANGEAVAVRFRYPVRFALH